ncbi:MAG: hypothetical protein IPO06_19650 [Leptospiraceae bacterium]|nr:hypothetical protein [Leptospiraceae bacterium]MBK9501548.1 hypothetical protein [Leptospiraceae bacterium]
MIFLLIVLFGPLLVGFVFTIIIYAGGMIILAIPGVIVSTLLFVLGEELKSNLLKWIAFISLVLWILYVMKKIDNRMSENIEKRSRRKREY